MADKTWQNGEILPADDFNRWEQSIAEYNPDFSAKTFEDENVPGTAEWNRVEQGIANMGANDVSRNFARGTNTPTLTSGTNYDDTTWRLTSGGNGTSEYIDLTDDNTVPVDGGMGVRNNTGSGNRDFAQYARYLEDGKTYTLSFYARLAGDYDSVRMLVRFYGREPSTGNFLQPFRVLLYDSEWQYFTYTWTHSTEQYTAATLQLGLEGVGSIDFCAVKVEEADSASAWSPAPEDIFTPNTIEDDTLIDADEANHIEQGIEDMINYAETYKDTSEADATPQSIKDSDEVAAPEAETIE